MRFSEILTEANKLTLRDFVVTISPHALDQCYNRGVNAHSVDDVLKNMSRVKNNIMGVEPGAAFILHNGLGTGLGFRRSQGNNLTLATVFKTNKDFVKGKHPTFKVDTYPDLKEDRELAKNRWALIVSTPEKDQWADNLIDLVHNAYQHTSLGSFVQNAAQVNASDWVALDWDPEPDLDCTVFYRGPRAGETWTGHKIQGIGHDGKPESKQKVIQRVKTLLTKPGNWIESSDAMSNTLGKAGLQPVTDPDILEALFPGSDLRLIDDNGTYERSIGQTRIKEQVFGNPVVK